MTCDSYYWKAKLAKEASLIERWISKSSLKRDRLLDEKITLAAYYFHKLLESEKLTSHPIFNITATTLKKKQEGLTYFAFQNESEETLIPIEKGSRIVERVNMPWELGELYDFASPKTESLNIKDLSNLIRHEIVFVVEDNQFLVTSDFESDSCLYCVKYIDFIKVMRTVAFSDIVEARSIRTKKSRGRRVLVAARYGFDVGTLSQFQIKMPYTSEFAYAAACTV
ncbi:MAG: hypothetical protein ACD_50C00328G0002 [uncultured bacterium]|nr:MAG: hypothetical protein ACD_50C00328G0002 [uncultured bacterium]OGN68534.1 MAG: hypothetical protein A3I67_03240 [Chlamydiae bacterium RIFCSPLOWO2_02_FULL_45_22]